jgi:hypothetical protein
METLETFLENATSFAVYEPTYTISDAGLVAAKQAFEWVNKIKFDREFNLDTDEALYCTELIYKAYREAGVDIIGGEFNIVEFPLVQIKEAIYPSLLIENDLFILLYSNEDRETQNEK